MYYLAKFPEKVPFQIHQNTDAWHGSKNVCGWLELFLSLVSGERDSREVPEYLRDHDASPLGQQGPMGYSRRLLRAEDVRHLPTIESTSAHLRRQIS